MTSEQLKGTPETLPNGDEVLVPDDEANEPILRRIPLVAPRSARSATPRLSARRLGRRLSAAFET